MQPTVLRFAEEILLLLNDERGDTAPGLPPHALDIVLAGAVLMDLALEDRIDTDLEQLILTDPTPVGDELLDPTLADIAQATETHDTSYWIVHTAKQSDEIRQKALTRLVARGILESEDNSLFFMARSVSRSRRYPALKGQAAEEVQLRIMRVLFNDDIPHPRDIVIISLAASAGVFESILSKEERAKVQERIDAISQLDLIGQSIAKALDAVAAPSPAVARSVEDIPQARGWPLVGNAFGMASDLRAFLAKQYVELGPIFRVRVFNRRFIVLAGPSAYRFATRQGKTHFRQYEPWLDFSAELGSTRTVISMDGADHIRLRRVQAAGYGRKRIGSHLAEAVGIIQRDIAAWPTNQALTAQYTFQRIIAEQLGLLLTGVSAREYLDDLIVFLEALLATRVTHHRPKLMLKWPRVQRARKRLHELYRKVIAAHQPENRGRNSPDAIDDLLELHRTDPQFLAEIDLMPSVLGPFIAGIDSAANTCAFMLYELLKRPELCAQATAEADALFSDGIPTAKRLRQFDVIHRVALETLRMYPIAVAQPHTTANSFEFEGYEVPVGALVLLGTSVAHYLPEYFSDPEQFDIDRYTAERAEHRQAGVYAPFGVGTHRCLGGGFAEVMIALTVATVLRETELALVPPSYQLKLKRLPVLHPGKSFKFRLVRRRT